MGPTARPDPHRVRSARWLGPGKIGLLESVARTGSLTGAAADCGMSYKRAWVLLKAANEIFGVPLVEMSKGGRGGGGGARVTAAGREVVAAYRLAERKATDATARAFAGSCPLLAPASPRPARVRAVAARRRRRRRFFATAFHAAVAGRLHAELVHNCVIDTVLQGPQALLRPIRHRPPTDVLTPGA